MIWTRKQVQIATHTLPGTDRQAHQLNNLPLLPLPTAAVPLPLQCAVIVRRRSGHLRRDPPCGFERLFMYSANQTVV